MATGTPGSINDILKYLNARAADGLPHGNARSLNEHLRGTLKILSHWRQPKDVLAAGLLHSIYGTDVYRQELVPISERDRIKEIAGASAERLIFLFGSLRRESFFRTLSREHGKDWERVRIERHRGLGLVAISRQEAGKLLVIHMANEAEQSRGSGGEPGAWIAEVSRWGAWAKPLTNHVPPVFSSCSTQVTAEDEQTAIECYGNGLEMPGENRRGARTQFAAAMKRLPYVAEPRVLLGLAALLDGRWRDAFQHATCALRLLHKWGTAWDKRLAFDEWESIGSEIIRCAEMGFVDPALAEKMVCESVSDSAKPWMDRLKSFSIDRRAQTQRLMAANGSTDATPPALPPRFLQYVSQFGSNRTHPKRNFYPGLRKEPVYPAERFALARALSASWRQIRDEFLRIQPHQGFQNEIERIGRTGSWTVFTLFELGRRNDANCALCPATTSIVERYGATRSILSLAYFSILTPGTHIAAHTGPTNMRLRCHLGIEVPDGCRLKVADRILTWREGECLVFDDSHLHEVWNDSDRRRVVLVVDIWHPDLTAEEHRLIEGLQRYGYAHASDLSGYWNKNREAREAYAAQARQEAATAPEIAAV